MMCLFLWNEDMADITLKYIQDKLKPVEKKIKAKMNFSREDVQLALNAIRGLGLSPDLKKQILTDLINGIGIKKIGIRTLYTPRIDLKEVDKTMEFLSDLYSYRGVVEYGAKISELS